MKHCNKCIFCTTELKINALYKDSAKCGILKNMIGDPLMILNKYTWGADCGEFEEK